jgi:putative photosynthetic complex assembly protein
VSTSDAIQNPDNFPRFALYAAAGIMSFALVAAVVGRVTGMGDSVVTGKPVVARDLIFADRGDGAVVITNADDHHLLTVMTGQNGFLRGTLRGMARARRSDDVGPAAPFRLTAWSDGRLTLDDPSTGRHIELEAFGPDNVAVFARILALREGTAS